MVLDNLKLTVLFVFGLLFLAHAQETIPTIGGDASGSGASISYTVGQLVYTAHVDALTGTVVYVAKTYEIAV